MSFSDGPRGQSTGRLLFYLTDLDASAADLEVEKASTHRPLTHGIICLCATRISIGDSQLFRTFSAQVDNRTTLSIGEIQMQGACGIMDPEVQP